MGKAKKLTAPRPRAFGPEFDLRTHGVVAEPLVLVAVPTRELAYQIFDEARRLCYRSMLRPCVVYGGGPFVSQLDELRKGCDILIGTPGRLNDFIKKGHVLSLKRLKYECSFFFSSLIFFFNNPSGTQSSTKLMSFYIRTGSKSFLAFSQVLVCSIYTSLIYPNG